MHLAGLMLGSCLSNWPRNSCQFLQALLSAALDPPPASQLSAMGAIAASLRIVLRLPGAMDDDAAEPQPRRRRVPPVRPQFPVKTKRAVVASAARRPRASKQKGDGTARQPWRMPSLWEPRQEDASAAADVPSPGGAVSAVTPFQAQAYSPAAELARPSMAATDGTGLRPLEAARSGAGIALDETSDVQEGGTAVLNAAVEANDKAPAAVDAEPDVRAPANVMAEASEVTAQHSEQELAAGQQPDVAAEESANSNNVAAATLVLWDTKAAAGGQGLASPPLPQRRRTLPRVWLSGRDPWGQRPKVYGSQPYSMQPVNGAAAPPATDQTPAAGAPAVAQPTRGHAASQSASNGVSNGAIANGSRARDASTKTAGDHVSYRARASDAAGGGAVPRRTTISANAAAGLLDARPPMLSQRTAPRPLVSSNGLSPGADFAAQPAAVPGEDASSTFGTVSEPIHQRFSALSAALSAALLAGAQPAVPTPPSEGFAKPTKLLEARPQLNAEAFVADKSASDHSPRDVGTDLEGSAVVPEDAETPVHDKNDKNSASPVVEGRRTQKGQELRQDAPRHTQQPTRRSVASMQSAAKRRAFRLGSLVRLLVAIGVQETESMGKGGPANFPVPIWARAPQFAALPMCHSHVLKQLQRLTELSCLHRPTMRRRICCGCGRRWSAATRGWSPWTRSPSSASAAAASASRPWRSRSGAPAELVMRQPVQPCLYATCAAASSGVRGMTVGAAPT